MDSGLLLSIVGAGLALAFFHAAIPTHWLPFVVAARAQGWSKKKTLLITALAGAGHIALTAVLGVLVIWFGIAVDHWTGNVFPWIAGGILIAFGLYYLVSQFRGHRHHHHHLARPHSLSAAHTHEHGPALTHGRGGHEHCDTPDDVGVARVSDAAAITSLFMLLTFSPCEAFIPIYVSSAALGWMGFALSTAVLAVGAITGMVVFTWLTMSGLDRFHLHKLERYEGAILGTVLCVLGAAFILFEA